MKFNIGLQEGDWVIVKRTRQVAQIREIHGSLIYLSMKSPYAGISYMQVATSKGIRKLYLKSKREEIIRDIGKFRKKFGL